LPPLYPLHIAIIQTIFGDELFILRLVGIIVTAGIALALYECLKGTFHRWIAAFAAASAVIYYQSGNAYIGYDFTQFLTLYLLLGTALLLRYAAALFGGASQNRLRRLAAIAGVFFGFAVLINQSNAGVTSLAAAFALAAVTIKMMPPRKALGSRVQPVLRACYAASGSLKSVSLAADPG